MIFLLAVLASILTPLLRRLDELARQTGAKKLQLVGDRSAVATVLAVHGAGGEGRGRGRSGVEREEEKLREECRYTHDSMEVSAE